MIKIISILFLSATLLSCTNKKIATKEKPIKSYQVVTLEPRDVTVYNDFPASIQGENVVEISPWFLVIYKKFKYRRGLP